MAQNYQNIEFNGIEYEAKSLIEFSSLTMLLFDLAKRQKELEKNYKYINESVLDKEQRVSDLEIKVLGKSKPFSIKDDSDSNKIKYVKKPSLFNIDNIKKNQLNSIREEKNYEGKANEEKFNEEKRNEEKSENKEDTIDSINSNKINSDTITKLYKRIKDIEKQISEMNIKSNKDIVPKVLKNQDKSNNKINLLEKNYEELNKKLITFNEEFDKMKVKVEDFNIYDIFKNEAGEGTNPDIAKGLIMNLENKIFKKFSLYDVKNKKNESDLFKLLEDIKNLKGLLDNFKIQNKRENEKINDIEKNLNDYINKNDIKIDEITNKIELLEKNNQKGFELNEMMKGFNKKLIILEEELKNNINNTINNIDKDAKNSSNNKKKIEDFDKVIKEIKKNIKDLDINLNQNIKNGHNSLKDKISLLEKEIQKKANSIDLNPIYDKINTLEKLNKEYNEHFDSLQQFNTKFKSDISNFNKKIEYLNGEFLRIKSILEINKIKSNPDLDTNNLLDEAKFNEFKKEIKNKNEKLKMSIDEIFSNIKDISASLSLFSTKKEFTQFQNNIMNLLEEFKLNCIKKYMEKSEINKNLRIIENQIKMLSDTYKKMDGSDNWLLAKKPLNNYQCASCEANLKDLEKKDNFVAWNKYPNREEKTYRMGHGFSRMLQMVNEEIIKNIENKEKGYVSDEDKKYINNNKSKYNDSSTILENKSIKLPKVKQKKIKNENKYGITVNKFILNNTPYEDADSPSPDEPKISKIYKINSQGKKLFGFNKTTNTENNNKSVNNTKIDYFQMNLTQPNNKK